MAENDKRNGRIGTIVFHAGLLILFLFVGLGYQDPPPEDGIEINFGYDDVGGGNTESAQMTQPQTQPQQTNESTPTEVDEVATQESVDAPAVTTEEESNPEPPKEEVEPDPTPSDRLNSALQSTRNGEGAGEGETEGGGDQGDPNGDPNSDSRVGTGGSGGSGNYRLGGRNALERPMPNYDCSDEGRVVVKVYVDRRGNVTRAEPGDAITNGPATNTFSSCLFDRAKQAALRTKWQGDVNAPEEQVGYIIYNFQKR